MEWIINSISMLNIQQQNVCFKYFITSRSNQDVMENTFSIFRLQGDFNRNLTARTFIILFWFQATHNLMKPTDISDCETDYEYYLLDLNSQNS